MNGTVQRSVLGFGIGVLLTALVIGSQGGAYPVYGAQTAPPLPPTWTPEPTVTPIPVPTLNTAPISSTAAPGGSEGFPTLVPTITPRAFLKEDLGLVAPLYYISKRFSEVRFLARALPNSGEYETLVKLDDQNVTAFDVSRSGMVAFATDQGLIYAAGRARPWSAFLKTASSQQVTRIAWSPDSKTLAFTVRASETDFAKMVRTTTTGVYVWPENGDPRLVIADRTVGKDRQNFNAYAWSPDGTLLLVSFSTEANGIVQGFGLYTAATRTYKETVRYTNVDRQRFQDGLWMRDGQSIYLYNSYSKDAREPSSVARLTIRGELAYLKIAGAGGSPDAISALRLLPDGRLAALAAPNRNQPLQVFIGKPQADQLNLVALGMGFKLKYPGVLLTPPTGFPLYIMDQQYGIQLFNSGKTLPYWPQEMRMGSLNNTDAFGDEFFPDWRFGPAEVTLPTVS